ncbi:MAG TPA: SCO family protein [Gemmatimonadales bacterium]|nr:SCO family protein [Gemmatimonadales bacterium]
MTGRVALALGALAVILLVTAAWWALALWPLTTAAPQWLARTREACFGAAPGGLPDAGGWILLLGEPLGMLGVLVVVWGEALREGLRAAAAWWAGRLILAGTAVALVGGVGAAARLVAEVRGEPFSVRTGPNLAKEVAAGRVDDPVPALRLVDQHGDSVTLDRFRGRPVVITFGYGHCETVCPLTVRAARDAVRGLADRGAVLVIITLDPWRDTPSRLPYLADGWELSEGMHLLGGDVATVERTLSAWRMPRVRNEASGDLSHPAIVYVVSPAGRLAYALGPDSAAIVAAVRATSGSLPSTPGTW